MRRRWDQDSGVASWRKKSKIANESASDQVDKLLLNQQNDSTTVDKVFDGNSAPEEVVLSSSIQQTEVLNVSNIFVCTKVIKYFHTSLCCI
jgi:hypothetical protein